MIFMVCRGSIGAANTVARKISLTKTRKAPKHEFRRRGVPSKPACALIAVRFYLIPIMAAGFPPAAA
jgi:hypothetical protein